MPEASRFELWWKEYKRSGTVGRLRLGATRDEVRALFGEPEQVGGLSRKTRQPRLWKYGPVEFHFDNDNRLFLVYQEGGDLETRTILREPFPGGPDTR